MTSSHKHFGTPAATAAACSVCCANITPLDVCDGVVRVWVLLSESLCITVLGVAGTTSHSRLSGVKLGIVGVQPVHLKCNVIPHGHDKHHASLQSLTHFLHAAFLREAVTVTKFLFLVTAPLGRNGMLGFDLLT